MEGESVTRWIDQLAAGDGRAAESLWQHIALRLKNFAEQKLDGQIRRTYDEADAANSAFHSLCRGLADGRFDVADRDGFWRLLTVITARKISARRRYASRQKRGGGVVRGDSGFDHLGDGGVNELSTEAATPEVIAEVAESCEQLFEAISDETMRQIVLLKFQGSTNSEVASQMQCTRRTIERKLERIRRIWVEAGLEDGGQ